GARAGTRAEPPGARPGARGVRALGLDSAALTAPGGSTAERASRLGYVVGVVARHVARVRHGVGHAVPAAAARTGNPVRGRVARDCGARAQRERSRGVVVDTAAQRGRVAADLRI